MPNPKTTTRRTDRVEVPGAITLMVGSAWAGAPAPWLPVLLIVYVLVLRVVDPVADAFGQWAAARIDRPDGDPS